MRLAVLLAVMMAACVIMIALAQDPGVNGHYTPDYWRLEKPAQQAAATAPEPAADAPKPAFDTPKAWYQQTIYPTKCVESDLSPADTIGVIVRAGEQARTQDYGAPANPSKVDVFVADDDGATKTWTYWRSIEACERDLPKTQPIPSKYR
jgi:hypothetical protein